LALADSSYAVHRDVKSYIGIYMALGQGAMYTASPKLLNNKSSIKAELVAKED